MEVRLNSPHGKFKRTDMADNQVDLTQLQRLTFLVLTLLKKRDRQIHHCSANIDANIYTNINNNFVFKSKW